MGHQTVFPHVGTQTHLLLHGKRIWPLVTGTFGGTDFISSLLGEAEDKLSQVSVTDLNAAVTQAQMANTQAIAERVKAFMRRLPGGHAASEEVDEMSGRQRPGEWMGGVLSAEEISMRIYPTLAFRDRISKFIDEMIDKVPNTLKSIDVGRFLDLMRWCRKLVGT
jgi:Heterokaryon incompatibility protein Het-C